MTTSPKYRDLAGLLPLAGAFLLMSPLIAAFNSVRLVFGLPLIVLYIFGVWLLLILGAILLTRHLAEEETAMPLPDPQADAKADLPAKPPAGTDPAPHPDAQANPGAKPQAEPRGDPKAGSG